MNLAKGIKRNYFHRRHPVPINHRKSTSSHAAVVTVLLMPAALSGDVRRVCTVRWAQRPLSVSLQPPVKVGAPALLSRVAPQLPQVRLIRSQMRGTVHLRTQERRIQNTSHKTLPPRVWLAAVSQTTKELFSEALCTCTSKDVPFIITFDHM